MKPTKEMPRRIGRKTVLVTDGFWSEVVHTRHGLYLPRTVPVDPLPLVMKSGGRKKANHERNWPVGTRFWYMGSSNTSAGFESLDFRAFDPMTYAGLCSAFEDTFACFTNPRQPDGYWAWHHCGGEFVWGTPNMAGRIILMDRYLTERPDGLCEWMNLPLLSKKQRKRKGRGYHEQDPQEENDDQ